jgi:hypothetical protein
MYIYQHYLINDYFPEIVENNSNLRKKYVVIFFIFFCLFSTEWKSLDKNYEGTYQIYYKSTIYIP